MQGDGQRLDQVGVLQGDPVGEGLGAGRVHPGLVGQTAVEADAVQRAEGGPALLLRAGPAPVAGPAVDHGQDGDRRAVVERPAELVTEDGRTTGRTRPGGGRSRRCPSSPP